MSGLRRGLVGYLTGPTAVGKTEVAVLLAERFGLSILSVDSRQIYRRLERGTAKPGAEERARAEHLLLDRLEPTETCSAGKYLRMAEDALEDLAARGRAALAVGGAGLYWEALAGGLHSLPVSTPESRARWEAVAEAEGVSGLLSRLRRVDPARASQLGPRDRQRIRSRTTSSISRADSTLVRNTPAGVSRSTGPLTSSTRAPASRAARATA